MYLKQSLSLLLLTITRISWGYIQELILYESVESDSNIFTFRKHIQDATIYLNTPAQICTRGIWVGYSEINFEGTATILIGQDDQLNCIEGPSTQFKSFRFGGSLETANYTISIYEEYNFGGYEAIVTVPADSIVTGKSLIFTGNLSWSLYDKEDFFGNAFCVAPDHEQGQERLGVYIQPNITASLGMSQIKSIIRREACPA